MLLKRAFKIPCVKDVKDLFSVFLSKPFQDQSFSHLMMFY